MTIKNRLSISNLFMILIPIFVCFLVGGISILTGYLVVTNNQGIGFDEEYFYSGKDYLAGIINEDLDRIDYTDELDATLVLIDSNNYRIEIYSENELVYEYGTSIEIDSSLREISNNIYIEQNGRQLYAYEYENSNGIFTVCIFANSQAVSYKIIKNIVTIIISILIITIVLSVFLTDYFLSKFIFKKIEEPLDLMLDATRKISNGDLDFSIEYYNDDEFKPIIEEFNRMASELKKSIEKIKEDDENRQMLIVGITHDIKSPLTSIKGYVEGLIDGVATTDEKRKKYLNIINKKCNDIDKLIIQMISLTKSDDNLCIENISIKNTIDTFIEENSESYRNCSLRLNCDALDDYIINGNKEEFIRVLFNLCDNALKYKNSDLANIYFYSKKENNKYMLIVEDDGPGVNEEDITHLFEPFYRSDKARNHPEKGSGLGLAIVRKVIEASNGKIDAENVEPHGLKLIMTWEMNNNE